MGKKNKNISGYEERKAVEEFIFMAEISTQYIKEYLKLENITINDLTLLNDKLETQIDKFYLDHKALFYKKNKPIFNNIIQLDEITTAKIEDSFDLEYGITKKHWIDRYKNLLVEFGTTETQSLISDKIINFSLLLQNEKNAIQLFMLAKNSIKKLSNKKEYACRLINIVETLENENEYMLDLSRQVKPGIKFWAEFILENSKELLKKINGTKGIISSDRVRTFILNALIEAAGIKAVGENKEKFIAEIINADSTIVGQYFNDFKKERFGMVEKNRKSVESEKSKEDEKKIKGNMFSRQMIEAKNVSCLLLNQMKSKERDVDVLKGNHIVEKMISIISSVEQVDLKEDKK